MVRSGPSDPSDPSASGERSGRLVAVLGMMAELGGVGPAEHERVGALAAALAGELVVVGEQASGIAHGARAAGLEAVQLVGRVEDVPAALERIGLRDGDVVLVKASRVAGLEAVAEMLLRETVAR
jgi:UDP-N-acetylmuramoyl-tripeptide--D-alanyl-D-alanine ligase